MCGHNHFNDAQYNTQEVDLIEEEMPEIVNTQQSLGKTMAGLNSLMSL